MEEMNVVLDGSNKEGSERLAEMIKRLEEEKKREYYAEINKHSNRTKKNRS